MKKANLALKDIPGIVASQKKKERKKGGLLWLWSKIKAPFVGASGGDGAAEGLASRAAAEIGESGVGEAGQLGGVGEISIRAAARVAAATPLIGKLMVAGVAAAVLGAGILAAHHFMGSADVSKSEFNNPIASGIRVHRPGAMGMKAAPEGVIGGGQNTTAGPNTSAGANTVTKNTGKAEANNPQTPAPQRTPQPDGLGNLQQPALAGGAPMGQSASMPNYGGQAAQEAALVKNALSQNAPVNVIPMSVSGAPIASGAMGSMRGRAFGSNALGHLRGMTGYNSNMQGSNYDQSAQNAINQFDNNGIASGGGISQGGLTSGTPDLLSGGNNNSPSSPGGVGGGAGSNSPTGDIPTVCSPDQINKGWVSNGASCVAGPTANTATNTTPWQSDLNWANILLMGAAAITGYLGFMVLWGDSLLSNPFTATEGVATLAHAALLTTAAGLMAGGAMALAIKIGLDGGTQQAIQIGIEGAAIGTGLALDWTGFCGWAIVASLVPFIGSLTSLIGIGI